MSKDRLTLKDAQQSGKLVEFIAQEEKRLPNRGNAARFDTAVKAAVFCE